MTDTTKKLNAHMAITSEQMKAVLQSADDVLVLREDGSFSPLKPGERICSGSAERALALFQRLAILRKKLPA